ncbi:cyclic nucleotide-binding domain-containing protein [Cohnella sp. REN36]|uniref:cyclic nucleotide-binding domain-containing protein n=1 Tax=Cohnella sp. REN36 TaxID=2887347 RepID=UPI001D14774E|nr:cyclic nucleotide-binding domain-containing protein [Cohnella sp. REN36]MCC3375079.1 cyclic nucleotide-binding domain-containing protein [Cohnella sp. REN36]
MTTPISTTLDYLRGHPLLRGVPEPELEAAAGAMTRVRYAEGERILTEGEPGDTCYFLVSGWVRVTSRSLIGRIVELAKLGPGELIGEIALLRTERRTASITASSPVDALRLDRAGFERLSSVSPLFHESLTYSANIRQLHGMLSKGSIWSAIPDSELRGLAEITVRRRAKAGEVVVRESEAPDRFFMIASGRFEVRANGRRAAVLGPGDYFGEIALLADAPRAGTVAAMEDGELLTMGKEEFRFVLLQYPPVKRQFLETLRIRRPDLVSSAEARWLTPEEHATTSGKTVPEAKRLRLPKRERWIDLLLAMGGLFAVFTALAAWLQQTIWIVAALLIGGSAGPVSFVAYARSAQLLGFRSIRLAGAFLASGAVAVPIAWFAERQWLVGGGGGSDGLGMDDFRIPLAVSIIEEAAKLLVCLLFLRSRRQRFRMDAVVFGAAVGMGFAAVESILYGWTHLQTGATGGMLAVLWLRALLSPFGHGTWTAIAAVGVWHAFGRGASGAPRLLRAAGLLAASVALHALWDFRFPGGGWRVAGMAVVGAAGIGLLLLLLRSGAREELRSLAALNPALATDRAAAGEAGGELACEACGTLSPPDARYCGRCGQALRAG